MEFRSFLVLFATSQVLFGLIGSTTPKPAADPSIPTTPEQKMAEMEARLAKMEAEAGHLSTRLREVEGQREDILMKVWEAVNATAVVLGRIINLENASIQGDHHLLEEVERAHGKIEQVVAKADVLQVKINDTQGMLNGFIASTKESEAVIRKNITVVDGNLKLFLNDSLNSGFQEIHSNFTAKMRVFENSQRRIEEECASYVSRTDENMRNREEAIQTEFQAIRSVVYQLEERCEDVAEMNITLRIHNSIIIALYEHIFNIQKICDSEPPAVPNGKTIDFERKHGSNVQYECDRSYVLTSNSMVHCNRGNWEGQPPVCSFFDTTFYLQTQVYGGSIYCFSVDNYRKINISRALDTGTGAYLPGSLTQNDQLSDTSTSIWIGDLPYPRSFGVFQCAFKDERGSMNIVVQMQHTSGDLYFVDPFRVANIGDAVEFEVTFIRADPIRWRHNGVHVRSWDNVELVNIPSVHPSDAGTYECHYEGERGKTAPALLRLIVRKCKKNLFGEHCDQQCPPCYNGGICHDDLGVCVCPPGFDGNNCEVISASETGRWDSDCFLGHGEWEQCLLCLPDPYGCSCAPGWKGMRCNEPCELGWYGADCEQPCHCARGPQSCDSWRGTCLGGCSPGWTGQSCQIQVVD